MAFNGSGVFTRLYSWVSERNLGNKIDSAKMDAEMDGMATGLSTAITRDGQTTILADIPWGGKKITSLADSAADTDALNRRSGDARFVRQVGGALTAVQAIAASAIDLASGRYCTKTAAGALTWTFTGAAAVDGFILQLTNGGTGAQTWPASVKWPGGTPPSLSASGTDMLVFTTCDTGTTWRGLLSQRNSS